MSNNLKPWENEPNYLKYRDPATGLLCVIIRHRSSLHLCGYVRLPHGNKKLFRRESFKRMSGDGYHNFTKFKRERRMQVHGGITWACTDGIGRPGGGVLRGCWVGFDCIHYGDYAPGYDGIAGLMGQGDGVYRTIDYVKAELVELCRQLKGIKA